MPQFEVVTTDATKDELHPHLHFGQNSDWGRAVDGVAPVLCITVAFRVTVASRDAVDRGSEFIIRLIVGIVGIILGGFRVELDNRVLVTSRGPRQLHAQLRLKAGQEHLIIEIQINLGGQHVPVVETLEPNAVVQRRPQVRPHQLRLALCR